MSKETKTPTPKTFEYQAEMKQLLHLIIHSLYTHPEVFLRELISNASDALNKIRYRKLTDQNILDPDDELQIKIVLDDKEQTFSIEDNGMGMTEEELIKNIGTIARSGTLEFLEKMKEGKETLDEHMIGQFGVGFYSTFMVTDEVTIETRYADKGSKGYRWKSSGEGAFSIEEIDKAKRGTKIFFKLKQNADEFCKDYKVKDTINKYSNFADFPILLGEEKVNIVSALWRKSSQEIKEGELNEFYKFISNDMEDPLGHLHLSIEGTSGDFKAIIFIPKTAPLDIRQLTNQKSLHLYSNKIMIQDDCKDLLPEYLRFLKGVVDSADLPLNVSRELVQASPAMEKIRSVLTAKILALLQKWANKDKEKYLIFYKNFGPLFKSGVNTDFTHRDKIVELMRFESSQQKPGELIALKEYVSRMKSEQKDIYYLSGQSREILEKNPNLEYFNKNKIEVLFLTEPVDIFIVPSIPEYDKKPIKSIDKADIDIIPEDKIIQKDDKLSDSLIALFKTTLANKVEDVVVSKRLVDSPVTLVTGKDGLDPQLEKMMKMMNQDTGVSKKVLEINTSHALLKNLSKMYIANSKDPLLEKCILQLHESAQLIDGDLPSSTEYVKRMTDIMQSATG